MSNKNISINKREFWSLRSSHERLAVNSGDVREIVLCAKVRLDNVCIGVTSGDRPNRLAYEDDTDHMLEAYRLLNEARITENAIAKENRKNR